MRGIERERWNMRIAVQMLYRKYAIRGQCKHRKKNRGIDAEMKEK
jgi:hypothetical protein